MRRIHDFTALILCRKATIGLNLPVQLDDGLQIIRVDGLLNRCELLRAQAIEIHFLVLRLISCGLAARFLLSSRTLIHDHYWPLLFRLRIDDLLSFLLVLGLETGNLFFILRDEVFRNLLFLFLHFLFLWVHLWWLLLHRASRLSLQ